MFVFLELIKTTSVMFKWFRGYCVVFIRDFAQYLCSTFRPCKTILGNILCVSFSLHRFPIDGSTN
jgi:hypothetical protein